jgi:two-component system OmpR family sensor kinase
MADAAHELRTPLTALHLQMGMLARASSEAERAAAMETLSAGVQRAIRLVEQLLSLARQEPRAQGERVPVRLDELAREVVAELVPLADAGRIDLGVSTAQPVSVRGDPDDLRTLLRNLVDNAVRYSGAAGRVDVSVEEVPAGDGAMARLTVSDNGPGIPPEERERVFDRFYRRAGATPPGSGLGLPIVRSIAEAHGISLTLADGPSGKGLSVTVSFRQDAQEPQPRSAN